MLTFKFILRCFISCALVWDFVAAVFVALFVCVGCVGCLLVAGDFGFVLVIYCSFGVLITFRLLVYSCRLLPYLVALDYCRVVCLAIGAEIVVLCGFSCFLLLVFDWILWLLLGLLALDSVCLSYSVICLNCVVV